jgi:hypothetical protein
MFRTHCHCGNLQLLARQSPSSITACNCSICSRIGALWAYYDRKKVEIIMGTKPVKTYAWGEKTISYHRCDECGCTTHYTSIESDGSELVAINCRMAPLAEISDIPVREFDGLKTWRYLDE